MSSHIAVEPFHAPASISAAGPSARSAGTPVAAAPGPLSDAYLPWALASGFRDAGGPLADGGRWLSLLLELHIEASRFFDQVHPLQRDWIRVPALYGRPARGVEPTTFCSAIVSRRMLAALSGSDDAPPEVRRLCAAIVRFEIGFTVPPWPVQRRRAAAPALKTSVRPGPGVVVGVIDDGLAFANSRFCVAGSGRRSQRSTRFLSLWDQGSDSAPGAGASYGRCYTADELDRHIAGGTGVSGAVDEDAVYARAGYREVTHRITHGTHVLDLACGCEPEAASAAPHIVGVQIPGDLLEDTSCASTTVFLLDAVHHILGEADRAFPALPAGPALINISMGNIAGPHDGSSIFESALEQLIGLRRTLHAGFHIVMPAGNSLLSRCHAWVEFKPQAALSFEWRVRPADGTPNFVELWFAPAGGSPEPAPGTSLVDAVTVTITPPGGPAFTVAAGQTRELTLRGQTIATASLHPRVANGRLAMGLIAVAPTLTEAEHDPRAPAGGWLVTVHNEGAASIECNAYVQRDDIAFGRRGTARQSIFDDPRYRLFDGRGQLELRDADASYVRRLGTFNGLATARLVDIAGGARHVASNAEPPPALPAARYSSVELPTAAGAGPRLHLSAVTEDSLVLHGVLASGTRSGSVVALSGTSMAAPQLVRALWEGRIGQSGESGQSEASARAIDNDEQPRPLIEPAHDLAGRSLRRRGGPTLTSATARSG